LFSPDDEGQERLEPSDETLVRTLSFPSVIVTPGTLDQGPVEVVCGLLAFDGGSVPSSYDLAVFDVNSAFAPPNPATDPTDDWIIRTPYLANLVSVPLVPQQAESKSKRKLPPDTGILGVIGTINLITLASYTITVNFTWDVRLAVRSGYTS